MAKNTETVVFKTGTLQRVIRSKRMLSSGLYVGAMHDKGYLVLVHFDGENWYPVRTIRKLTARPRKEQQTWHIEIRDSRGYCPVESEATFVGTEQEAIQDAKNWLREALALDSYQKEVLVINKATEECVYQGTFDMVVPTLVRWIDNAKASYPVTQDDIPSEEIAELPVMPDQATLENWQHDFNEWGKLATTGSGVSLETSRVTDELELIIQCLEKNICYDGKPSAETRLLKLVNLFARCMRKRMDNDQDWQACTQYQQDLLFVRKAFLERYCEYARFVLFTNVWQEKPRIPVLA